MNKIIPIEKVRRKTLLLVILITALSCSIFLLSGYSQLQFISSSAPSKGYVVDNKIAGRTTRHPSVHPVVSYTYQNELFEFTSATGFEIPRYAIGEEIPILVSLDGNEAKINTFWRMWGTVLFSGMIGLFLLRISFALAKKYRKPNNNKQ